MYEELVARLKDRARREDEYYAHGGDVINEAADAIEILDMITDNLNYLYESEVPRWIPVTERLPEAWEEVMLQFPNNQAAGFFDGDCGWGVFSGDDFYTYVAPEEVHPTHWAKKLPEPPKEET